MATNRLTSIDIFRALTMLLMIFVIDLGSLSDIPAWLNHADMNEDRMGLADIVLPCFMFIIGLSIPHAIEARLAKGHTKHRILLHILSRTGSLILMGLYVVNMDAMFAANISFAPYWQLCLVVAVVLIWNDYSSTKPFLGVPKHLVQAAGWALLAGLAYVYEGPNNSWMQIHWWGILGLLGWSYGLSALLYLGLQRNVVLIGFATAALLALNANEFVGAWNWKIVISASNHFSVMLGVFVTVVFQLSNRRWNLGVAAGLLISLAVVLFLFGFVTRPIWEISKIRATPSWASICAGISIFCFLLLVIIADVKKVTVWARPIMPGGSATLTCYFALYFLYSIISIVGLNWSEYLLTGVPGLLKSFCFALFVIGFSGLMARFGVRLNV